jgi:hypothetical protein
LGGVEAWPQASAEVSSISHVTRMLHLPSENEPVTSRD